MRRRVKHRGGFTTVDVCAAVMVLLLGVTLLLPVLGYAQLKSQRIASEAQLRAISAACDVYEDQMGAYPGYFPRSRWGNSWFRDSHNANEGLVVSLMGTEMLRGREKDYVDVSGDRLGNGFYRPAPRELGVVWGSPTGRNNRVPELLDVASGAPILFARAGEGTRRPVGQTTSEQDTLTLYTNYSLVSSGRMKTPSDGYIDQYDRSLLSPGALGWETATANLAMAVVDEAVSGLSTGDSPNRANDGDDRFTGKAVFIAPGRDGVYLSRDQLGGGQTVIDARTDMRLFDDVVFVGGSGR